MKAVEEIALEEAMVSLLNEHLWLDGRDASEKPAVVDFATRLLARVYREQGPVVWVRRHPDGALTAEFLEAETIEPVRKQSGAWIPLYTTPQPCPDCVAHSNLSLEWMDKCHASEAKCRELEADNANLRTVMMAAAVEITEQWAAHCNDEGYRPCNLVRRLENGFPEQYGYDSETVVRLDKRINNLTQERDAFLLRVQQFDQHIRAIGHHVHAVCGGVDVDQSDPGSTAATIIAKFDVLQEYTASIVKELTKTQSELERYKLRAAAMPPKPMPKYAQLQDPDPTF